MAFPCSAPAEVSYVIFVDCQVILFRCMFGSPFWAGFRLFWIIVGPNFFEDVSVFVFGEVSSVVFVGQFERFLKFFGDQVILFRRLFGSPF